MKIAGLVFFSVFLCSISGQNIFELQPDSVLGKDSRINSVDTYTSGSDIELPIAAWTFSGTPGIDISLIEFNLSSLPSTSHIVLAQLCLFGSAGLPSGGHSTASGSNEIIIQRIVQNWDEHGVTWSTQPNSTSVNQVISMQSTDIYQDFVFDVTEMVQDMIDYPLNSFGFLLKPLYNDYYRKMNFCSSDHPERKKRPKLIITYNNPTSIESNSRDFFPFKIYSNPVVDNLKIESINDQFFNIVIYNLLGEKVFSSLNNKGLVQVNSNNFISGLYFLKITSDKKEYVEKIRIQ